MANNQTVQCPTCEGSGRVHKPTHRYHDPWDKFCGMRKLWRRYSHAAIKIGPMKRFSAYCKIMSIDRNSDGTYTLNTTLMSCPVLTLKEMQENVKFLDRKTGEPVPFEDK